MKEVLQGQPLVVVYRGTAAGECQASAQCGQHVQPGPWLNRAGASKHSEM